MKKNLLTIGAVVVVSVLTLLVIKSCASKVESVTFNTAKVTRGTVADTVTATGTIDAITSINVGTQVSGIIQHIYVDFNDNVKQGQLLAKLDETNLREQLKQSQASLDQAQAQLNYKESTWKRMKALYDKNLISQSDYDEAVYNFENAKAAMENAKSSLSRANVNLDYATITSPIDGVVLNRAVEEGQTVAASFSTPTLFTIVNDLTQMEVETSVDEADIGKVKEGQNVKFSVDAYPDVEFKGTVSQVRLEPTTTNNVVTYKVIINAPNPDKKLMPGMTASAVIYVDERDNALTLSSKALRFTPTAAYLKKNRTEVKTRMRSETQSGMKQETTTGTRGEFSRPGSSADSGQINMSGTLPSETTLNENASSRKIVWKKDEKGKIHPVPVKVGLENGKSVEILWGLKEGDEIVISMDDGSAKLATKQSSSSRTRGPMPF